MACPINKKEVLNVIKKIINKHAIKDKKKALQAAAIRSLYDKIIKEFPDNPEYAVAFKEYLNAGEFRNVVINFAFEKNVLVSNEIFKGYVDSYTSQFPDIAEESERGREIALQDDILPNGQTNEADDFPKNKHFDLNYNTNGVDSFTPYLFQATGEAVSDVDLAEYYRMVEEAIDFDDFESKVMKKSSAYKNTYDATTTQDYTSEDYNVDRQSNLEKAYEFKRKGLKSFYLANLTENRQKRNDKNSLTWTNLNPAEADIVKAIVPGSYFFQPKREVRLTDGRIEPDHIPVSFLDSSKAKVFGSKLSDLTHELSLSDLVRVIAKKDGSFFGRNIGSDITTHTLNKWNEWLSSQFGTKVGGKVKWTPLVIAGMNTGDPGNIQLTEIHPQIMRMLIPSSTVEADFLVDKETSERQFNFLKAANFNLFRALRKIQVRMNQYGSTPSLKKTLEDIRFAKLRKYAAKTAFKNYIDYFREEMNKGYISEEDFNIFIQNAKNPPTDATKAGGIMMPMHMYLAGIIAKHEWWKAARFNTYNKDSLQVNANRLRLNLTKGMMPKGHGPINNMIWNHKKLEVWVVDNNGNDLYKVENMVEFKELMGSININDGMSVNSSESLDKLADAIGRNQVYPWESKLREFKAAYTHRSDDGNDYIEIKNSNQLAIPNIRIRNKAGETLISIVEEMGQIRIIDNQTGNYIDQLHDLDVTKTLSGEYDIEAQGLLTKTFELPEDSMRIIKSQKTISHTNVGAYRQYMATLYMDKLNKENQEDLDKYSKLLGDTMLSMADKHWGDFNEVMSNPESLAKLLAHKLAQQHELGDELATLLNISGNKGIYHPTFMTMIKPILNNMIMKKSLLEGRIYEDKINHTLQTDYAGSIGVIKADSSSLIKEPDKHVIASADILPIYRLAVHKYIEARGWNKNDTAYKEFLSKPKSSKVADINAYIASGDLNLYTNVWRTPIAHQAGMVIRKIQAFEPEMGTALKYHPKDVSVTFIGDADIDTTSIIMVPEEFAKQAIDFQNTEYFKKIKQVTADLSQFEGRPQNSLADYNGTLEGMVDQLDSNLVGIIQNAKVTSALMSVKLGDITLTDGTVVRAKRPNEWTLMDYAPLKQSIDGNPISKSDIENMNPNFASVVEIDGQWYLKTTVEHEFLLLLNAATDHAKVGLLNPWGFRDPQWLVKRQFKIIKGEQELSAESIKTLTSLAKHYNYSDILAGKSRARLPLKLDQLFYRLKEIDSFVNSTTEKQKEHLLTNKDINIEKKDKISGNDANRKVGLQDIEVKSKVVSIEKLLTLPIRRMVEEYGGIENIPEYPGAMTPEQYGVIHHFAMDQLLNKIKETPEAFGIVDFGGKQGLEDTRKWITDFAENYYDNFYQQKNEEGAYAANVSLSKIQFDKELYRITQDGVEALDYLVEVYGPGVSALATLEFLKGIGSVSGSELIKRKNIQHFPPSSILDNKMIKSYLTVWESVHKNKKLWDNKKMVEQTKRQSLPTLSNILENC